MREEKLIAYLKGAFKGRNKTIKSAELERAMEMSGTDLRKLVNKLRRKSIPICSGADGYFYAKTAGDILRTIRQLKVMIKGLQAAVDGLEAALDKFVEPCGAPAETQQSGLGGERRSSEVSEFCRLRQDEGYGACDDEKGGEGTV
jgi:hypothetical protein|nr:hypothetical protein [uncultured Oscillibacter sp.]